MHFNTSYYYEGHHIGDPRSNSLLAPGSHQGPHASGLGLFSKITAIVGYFDDVVEVVFWTCKYSERFIGIMFAYLYLSFPCLLLLHSSKCQSQMTLCVPKCNFDLNLKKCPPLIYASGFLRYFLFLLFFCCFVKCDL